MPEQNDRFNPPTRPRIAQRETHPRVDDPEPYEKTVSTDGEELTIGFRYDDMGTFESIRNADVALFCLEEPQKDFIKELLYVIVETDKQLVIQLTTRLLYGQFIMPFEEHETTMATEDHIEQLPDQARTIIDLLRDLRSSDSYDIIFKELF